ncbi:MAG: ABC transporter ATP-binding protein [Oscillospiraceae bacterium]|nr:ABC transporter ATP-binding protein [Oscillospiraceae bacterium]
MGDDILPSAVLKRVIYAVLCYILIAMMQSVISYFCSVQSTMLMLESSNNLKLKLIKKIFIRTGDFFTQNSRGELYQNVESDSAQFCEFVINNIISIFVTIVNLLVAIVFLLFLDWKLMLIILAVQPIIFIFQMLMTPEIIRISKKTRDISADYVTLSQEVLSNPIELILSGYKENMVSRLVQVMRKYLDITRQSVVINMFSANAGEFLSSITLCAVIAYSGINIISGNMSVGELVVFITYAQKIVSGISSLVDFSIDMSEIEPIYDRIKEQLSYEPPEKLENPVFSETPEICVEAVDFSYDSKVKIYNNFDYVFHYGKKYELLFGLWSPDSGRITIDERDCSELEYDDLSSIITYVSSTPIIIHDTLYNNLTMYDKNISEDMIWEVLKKVELEELFSDNEDKLNTIIGDNGITLSSGQRQRLSLARTMLIGRRIIILDEPTSALDEATTELITKLLYEEFNDKTLIIISHNKSVLKNCDRILKIEKGKVMEVE